jgi:hypothetical protein
VKKVTKLNVFSVGLSTMLVGLLTSMVVMTGCDVDPAAIKPVAQNAGLFSAVGWIAIDNPAQDEIKAVKTILSVISDKASGVSGGSTYTEVVYPEVDKVITEELEAQYQPLARAASVALLGSLDMLFASHPEWKKSQDTVTDVVNAFVLGADAGLGMSRDSDVRVIAEDMAMRRARVFQP